MNERIKKILEELGLKKVEFAELDQKMKAEEEAYWKRIRQSEKRTDSRLRRSMAFSIASLLAVILAMLLLWR